ncbi:MAG: hypothetical protein ACYC6Y_17585 [Thermoguttaceae bacterium]
MNRVVYYGSAVLAALVLGSVLSWWTVGRGMKGGVECGAWRHYPSYGSGAVSPYVFRYFIGDGTHSRQIESARRRIRIERFGGSWRRSPNR